jgi:hypothetical protein
MVLALLFRNLSCFGCHRRQQQTTMAPKRKAQTQDNERASIKAKKSKADTTGKLD